MTDLSTLSNEELMSLYQRQQAQSSLSSLSDEQLKALYQQQKAASYVQPEPPPGVTIHTGNGDVYSQGGGKFQPATEAESAARFNREANGMTGDRLDALARGLPFIGEFLPRGRAAVNSAMGNGDYAGNLEREQARVGTYDAEHPYESMALRSVGPVAGAMTAANYAGPIAQAVMGVGGRTIPAAMAIGGLSGGVQGGLSAAGQSRDLTSPEATLDILKGTALGAGIGAAVPAVGGAAGKLWDAAMRRAATPLNDVSPAAQRYVLDQLDPGKVAILKQEADKLGPQGMLADVSPEFAGIARGASARPGSRSAIVDALNARDAGKNARIGSTIKGELGDAVSPLTVENELEAARKALSPEYEHVFNSSGVKAVDTKPIADVLDTLAIDKRGPAQAAAKEVRSMLEIPGANGVLDPNPRTLHAVRQAIDGMMKGQAARENSDVMRVLTQSRKAIDAELAAKVPGIKAVDSKFADIARQEGAYETGKGIFRGGENPLWPDQVQKTIDSLKQPAGSASGPPTAGGLERLTQGARAKLEEIVGLNSNDLEALLRTVKVDGDWNRDKMRMIFGQDKADKVLSVLDAEKTMQNTKNWVVGNSATGATQQFADDLKGMARGNEFPHDYTATGLLLGKGRNLINALLGKNAEADASKFAEQLGRLSVAQGPQRDAIIDALLKRSTQRQDLRRLLSALGGTGAAASTPLVNALAAPGGRGTTGR